MSGDVFTCMTSFCCQKTYKRYMNMMLSTVNILGHMAWEKYDNRAMKNEKRSLLC